MDPQAPLSEEKVSPPSLSEGNEQENEAPPPYEPPPFQFVEDIRPQPIEDGTTPEHSRKDFFWNLLAIIVIILIIGGVIALGVCLDILAQ